VDSYGEPSGLRLRLPARAAQVPLLRAELRLWLMQNRAGSDNEVHEVLSAATKVFMDALGYPGQLRTIAVEVEASYTAGAVALTIHDYASGKTVELQRAVTPARPRRTSLVAGSFN
jgi:hypothetical protein